MKYTFHAQTMHIHTCHQPGSSMQAHMHNAASLGMQYIRFTDHDTRTGPLEARAHSFDFSQGELSICDERGNSRTWEHNGGGNVYFADGAMCLAAEDQECAAQFSASGKSQSVSLLADVSLTLGLTAELGTGGTVILDITLSQRPPDHAAAHLWYVRGEIPAERPPHTLCLPMPEAENGIFTLTVSEDMERIGQEIGGLDNAFVFFSIRVRNGVCRVNLYDLQAKYGFERVISRQRALAEEIGAKYGIKPFVTTEISGAGQHKNCFSTAVPVIDYAACGYKITAAEAIAHVKRHGGIFCYNHPFENAYYKKTKFEPHELPRVVEAEAASLIASRVWGASLMEIGFPKGRGQFSQADYLRLWDLISLAGVFITGCGDSDSHYSDRGWFSGNNFASWIAAPADMPFPVSEETFIESMKAGRVYAGDPVLLHGEISLTAGDAPMGAILPIGDRDKAAREMCFRASELEAGMRVRIIIDGECTEEHTVAETGAFACTFAVAPRRTVSFARAEICTAGGRYICMTNPIYLVRAAEYAGELPAERLYGKE